MFGISQTYRIDLLKYNVTDCFFLNVVKMENRCDARKKLCLLVSLQIPQ